MQNTYKESRQETVYNNLCVREEHNKCANVEDDECFAEGRRKALTEIYTQLWKKVYYHRPTEKMINMEGIIDDNNYRVKKQWVYIVFNPKPEIWKHPKEAEDFYQWVIQKRIWMKDIMWAGWENREGSDEKSHVNMVVRLKKFLSPAQIQNVFFQGKTTGERFFGNKLCINVQKCDSLEDAERCILYSRKKVPGEKGSERSEK